MNIADVPKPGWVKWWFYVTPQRTIVTWNRDAFTPPLKLHVIMREVKEP